MKPFPFRGGAIAIAVFLSETATPNAFLLPSPSASACATAFPDAASSSRNFHTTEKGHRIKILSTLRGGGSGSGGGSVNGRRVKSIRNAAASDGINEDSSKDGSNEQSIPTAALNLIKGCVGSGVLSLPAGVAAIGDVTKA